MFHDQITKLITAHISLLHRCRVSSRSLTLVDGNGSSTFTQFRKDECEKKRIADKKQII